MLDPTSYPLFGVLILALFNLLRLSIREGKKSWRGILRQSRGTGPLPRSWEDRSLRNTTSFLVGAQMEAAGAFRPGLWIPGIYVLRILFRPAAIVAPSN